MNAVAMAEIGHNSASYLQMIEADPAIVYRDDEALPGLTAEIEALIAAASGDVGTKKGREAIASLAHSISRRKTPILDAGKRLTEDWRKKTAEVNGRKSQVERDMDALRDKARAPLDAWEAAEKTRLAKIDAAMSSFRYLMKPPIGHTTVEFDVDIAAVEAVEITDDFGDQRDTAEDLKVEALTALRAGRAAFIKAEAERAELARLRAAEEERQRVERAADIAHRGKIMGEAKTALMTLDIDEAKAKQIVLAICAGTIPHTRISF